MYNLLILNFVLSSMTCRMICLETKIDNIEHVLEKLIRQHVNGAVLIDSISAEVTFQLPDDRLSVAKFKDLFDDLDSNLSSLGITGYGISNTTLEEVSRLCLLISF